MMVVFAYVTSYYPDYMGFFFILYMIATMGIMLVIAGRGAVKVVRDLEYVKAGKKLFAVDRGQVEKLKARDRMIEEELKGQRKIALIQTGLILFFMAIFIFPGLRGALTLSLIHI